MEVNFLEISPAKGECCEFEHVAYGAFISAKTLNRWGQMGTLFISSVLMHKTIDYFVWACPWQTTSAAYILRLWS